MDWEEISHYSSLLILVHMHAHSLDCNSLLLYVFYLSTLLYSTLLYSTLLYSTLLSSPLLYSTLLLLKTIGGFSINHLTDNFVIFFFNLKDSSVIRFKLLRVCFSSVIISFSIHLLIKVPILDFFVIFIFNSQKYLIPWFRRLSDTWVFKKSFIFPFSSSLFLMLYHLFHLINWWNVP